MTAIAPTPSMVIQNALDDLQRGVDRKDDFRVLISAGYIGVRHLMEQYKTVVTQAMNEQLERIVAGIATLSRVLQPPPVAPLPVAAQGCTKTNRR